MKKETCLLCTVLTAIPKKVYLRFWKNLFGFILAASLLRWSTPLYNVSDEWPLISGGMVCT